MGKILIAEDDETLRTLVSVYLAQRDHRVMAVATGAEALALAREGRTDLAILDVMMPKMDGWQVIGELRKISQVPVIFVTALGDEPDVIRGLELGADDYLRKPFSMKELELRVQALLRRSASSHDAPGAYDDGRLRVDLVRRTVLVDGNALHLTPTEFRLLAYLVERDGRAVSHRELLREVWGPEYQEDVASLQVYIRYLREKIEADPRKPSYIRTEWGVGYRFATNPLHQISPLSISHS